jgi:NAD(P)-dependent dehydrogenase (short-subunit alcohol dehydrogenase family)
VRGDAANLDDLDRLFDTVKREKGKIDVLFAALARAKPSNWARLPSSTSMRPSA